MGRVKNSAKPQGIVFAQVVNSLIVILKQCSKLRVHPSPRVHILVAGCTDFCAPGRCMFFFEILNIVI